MHKFRAQTDQAMEDYKLLWRSAELVLAFLDTREDKPTPIKTLLEHRRKNFEEKYETHRAEQAGLIGMETDFLLYPFNEKHESAKSSDVNSNSIHNSDQTNREQLDEITKERILDPKKQNMNPKEYLETVQSAVTWLRDHDSQLNEELTEVYAQIAKELRQQRVSSKLLEVSELDAKIDRHRRPIKRGGREHLHRDQA